jgi:N-acetylglutamate synthase-like GNAT family acetyltransferase
VGVLPDKQGRGVGTELLTCKLAELDTHRIPAYLEASKFRAAQLYERLGFKRVAARIVPPDGPPMYPMWRSPTASARLSVVTSDLKANGSRLGELCVVQTDGDQVIRET